MSQTAKLTVTVPRNLILLADQIANEKRISRSKLVSYCLQELADKRMISEMEEGYKTIANELREFASMASEIEHEVILERE